MQFGRAIQRLELILLSCRQSKDGGFEIYREDIIRMCMAFIEFTGACQISKASDFLFGDNDAFFSVRTVLGWGTGMSPVCV